ncbi:MAG: hypothetical protein ABIP89_00535 [Polyangiaceae bacterium]
MQDRHPMYALSLPLLTFGLLAQGSGWLGRWSFPRAGAVLSVVGTLMVIVGIAFRAKDKGHSGAWGILGLLSFVGVIAVSLLPNRHQRTLHN